MNSIMSYNPHLLTDIFAFVIIVGFGALLIAGITNWIFTQARDRDT